MSLFFRQPELTSEQIAQIRKARTDFQDFLTKTQTNTTSDATANRLTPEGAKSVLNQIKIAQTWLSSTPNANLNEILTKRDEIVAEINRVLTIDAPLGRFYNGTISAPVIINTAFNKKLIDSTLQAKLLAESTNTTAWYNKNMKTVTSIDIQSKIQELQDKFNTLVSDPTAKSFMINELTQIVNQGAQEARLTVTKHEDDLKKVKDATVDINEGMNTILNTCIQTFVGLFVVAFLLMCGSFAANFAIGRVPAYRVLYFIWGALPPFAPLVLLYAIYKRLRDGRLPIYAMLPLSIEPATTRLGKYLWYPFYWVPDNDATSAYKAFEASLKETMSA